MRVQDGSPGDDVDLALLVKRRILERTQGRVSAVQVEVAEDRLTVHGRADSYHVKQLALEAIGEVSDIPVELNIKVGG